jgi:hypothetical protein
VRVWMLSILDGWAIQRALKYLDLGLVSSFYEQLLTVDRMRLTPVEAGGSIPNILQRIRFASPHLPIYLISSRRQF